MRAAVALQPSSGLWGDQQRHWLFPPLADSQEAHCHLAGGMEDGCPQRLEGPSWQLKLRESWILVETTLTNASQETEENQHINFSSSFPWPTMPGSGISIWPTQRVLLAWLLCHVASAVTNHCAFALTLSLTLFSFPLTLPLWDRALHRKLYLGLCFVFVLSPKAGALEKSCLKLETKGGNHFIIRLLS